MLLDVHDPILLVAESLGRAVAAEPLHYQDGVPANAIAYMWTLFWDTLKIENNFLTLEYVVAC